MVSKRLLNSMKIYNNLINRIRFPTISIIWKTNLNLQFLLRDFEWVSTIAAPIFQKGDFRGLIRKLCALICAAIHRDLRPAFQTTNRLMLLTFCSRKKPDLTPIMFDAIAEHSHVLQTNKKLFNPIKQLETTSDHENVESNSLPFNGFRVLFDAATASYPMAYV